MTGAAYVGWDSTYAFNADGRADADGAASRSLQYPDAPLGGVAEFTATGNGTFDVPRNDMRFRVTDLSVGRGSRRAGDRHARAARHTS